MAKYFIILQTRCCWNCISNHKSIPTWEQTWLIQHTFTDSVLSTSITSESLKIMGHDTGVNFTMVW